MRDPFAIVAAMGNRLDKQPTGWRDMKALVVLVGRVHWGAAADLADALGIHPDQQKQIHDEIRDHPEGIDTPKAHRSKKRAL